MNCWIYVNGACVKQVSGLESVYRAYKACCTLADELPSDNTVWLVSADTGEILEEYHAEVEDYF